LCLKYFFMWLLIKWRPLPQPVRVRRYLKRDLPKDKLGYEKTPPLNNGPYCLLPSFANFEQPTGNPIFESFYIGPIFGTGKIKLEEEEEYDEYKSLRELLKILEQKYDYHLIRDEDYCDIVNRGYEIFSTMVKWVIERSSNGFFTYFLLDKYGNQTSSESISIEKRQMQLDSFNNPDQFQMFIIFSQYWDGKSPRLLPSLFKEIQMSKQWSDDRLKRFKLDDHNRMRHTDWKKFGKKISSPTFDSCFEKSKEPWWERPSWMFEPGEYQSYSFHESTIEQRRLEFQFSQTKEDITYDKIEKEEK